MKYSWLLFTLLINHYAYPEGFFAGTLVKTIRGYVPIEQLKMGDKVIGANENNFFDLITIRSVNTQQVNKLVLIKTGYAAICVAPDQFFWSRQRGWIKASKIKPGETIGNMLNAAEVSSVETIELSDGCVDLYALSLFGPGILFVSTNNIAAYNSPHSIARSAGETTIHVLELIIATATLVGATILLEKLTRRLEEKSDEKQKRRYS